MKFLRWGWALTAFLLSPLLLPSVYAGIDLSKPEIVLQAGVRGNTDEEAEIDSEAVGRAQAIWTIWEDWAVTPFVEGRRSVDSYRWSRVELGAELGYTPVRWFYLGNGFQGVWLSPGSDHPEWEIRTIFTIPVKYFTVRSEPVKLYLGNEYTFDLADGAGTRNEILAGVKTPLPFEHWNLITGWRHVDPVHSTDSDQLEAHLEFRF